MPDDTDLTPQAPEPEQPPAETSGDTSAEPANTTSTEPAATEANPVMELALKDLQDRRDALEAEINALSSRKQQLETELKANFAGQSDAIARRVKGFQEYLGGALQDLCRAWKTWSWWCSRWWCSPPPSIRRQTTQRCRTSPVTALRRPRWPTPSAPMKS